MFLGKYISITVKTMGLIVLYTVKHHFIPTNTLWHITVHTTMLTVFAPLSSSVSHLLKIIIYG